MELHRRALNELPLITLPNLLPEKLFVAVNLLRWWCQLRWQLMGQSLLWSSLRGREGQSRGHKKIFEAQVLPWDHGRYNFHITAGTMAASSALSLKSLLLPTKQTSHGIVAKSLWVEFGIKTFDPLQPPISTQWISWFSLNCRVKLLRLGTTLPLLWSQLWANIDHIWPKTLCGGAARTLLVNWTVNCPCSGGHTL